jgi:hypothetical protein
MVAWTETNSLFSSSCLYSRGDQVPHQKSLPNFTWNTRFSGRSNAQQGTPEYIWMDLPIHCSFAAVVWDALGEGPQPRMNAACWLLEEISASSRPAGWHIHQPEMFRHFPLQRLSDSSVTDKIHSA